MSTTAIVILGVLGILTLAFLAGRFIRLSSVPAPKPCFRCGTVAAVGDFQGVPYCRMCMIVVPSMISTVRHDPPFGFPGANGYTEFVTDFVHGQEETKKES